MIKAVIFDFFGVIHNDQYNDWLSTHGLQRTGKFRQLSQDADKGIITTDDFFAGIAKLNGTTEEIVKKEFETNTKMDVLVLKLVQDLKNRGLKTALLSNASSNYLHGIDGFDRIEKLFDHVVVSGDVGLAKPDPAIYKYTLELLGVEPKEAIFIDDSNANVETAKALGIIGIQFQTHTRLLEDLKNFFK